MKLKSTGSKHTALAKSNGKSKNASPDPITKYPYLAICIHNPGNEASLQRGKAYRVIKPLPSDPPGRIRVIDEEKEDYLYQSEWFVPIQVPDAARKTVLKAVSVG